MPQILSYSSLPFCSSTCFICVFDLLTAPLEHHDLNIVIYVSAKHPLILNFTETKNKLIRMHFRRMRTARFSGRLYRGWGVCLWNGGCLPLGLRCFYLWVWGCLPHLFTTPPSLHPLSLHPFITTLFHHTPISPHTPLYHTLHEKKESQTGVKTLPSRNFVCGRQ